MSAVSPQELLHQLNWRYATKKFDPSKEIPADTWKILEQALILTPSSFGLQPWKFFIIKDKALRAQLKNYSWNQDQITDASHLIVFAQKLNLNAGDIDRFIARIAAVRNVPSPSLDGYKQVMLGFAAKTAPGFNINEWATRQVYIALGNFLTSAAVLGIDACPMEGLDPDGYDTLLGLGPQGYHTCCVAAAGYRSSDDAYAAFPKVRFPAQEVIKHL